MAEANADPPVACPKVTLVPGTTEPMRRLRGFAGVYVALMSELSALPNVKWAPLPEVEARQAVCAAIAVRPDRSQEVLLGTAIPPVPGKEPCGAPGPHWIQLYPWETAWFERWQITPIDRDDFIAVVQKRWGLPGREELEVSLDLSREARFVVAEEGATRWACANRPDLACVAETYRMRCPQTGDECVDVGYQGKITVYDPISNQSLVADFSGSRDRPELEVRDATITVRAGTCIATHTFT